MSSFLKQTVNPDTHEVETAEWLDDYFGNHNYGVRFPSTGIVYRADEYEWAVDQNMMATRAVSHHGGVITRVNTAVGKNFETKEHADGRKDVTIEVNTLDVEPKDEATAAAKKVIEEKVLPAIAEAKVLVTVIHKPTNESASFSCARKNVRDFAEKVVAKHGGAKEAYCLVQNDGDAVTVTTL